MTLSPNRPTVIHRAPPRTFVRIVVQECVEDEGDPRGYGHSLDDYDCDIRLIDGVVVLAGTHGSSTAFWIKDGLVERRRGE